MWSMLQQNQPEDFVIAAGQQYSVRDFVNAAAGELGMTIRWEGDGINQKGYMTNAESGAAIQAQKCIVQVDPRYFRPTEVETLLGDAAKARAKLNWTPETSFQQLVKEMVLADFESAKRDELVKRHGYQAMHYHE
jgi:GDPmannose 4,6-dehydratase